MASKKKEMQKFILKNKKKNYWFGRKRKSDKTNKKKGKDFLHTSLQQFLQTGTGVKK